MNGKGSSSELNSFEKEILKEISKIRSYSWINPESVVNSLESVKEVVAKSIEAGLNRETECGYAGIKFLFTLLETTSRGSTSSIEEANQIFMVGMKIANKIWSLMEEDRNLELLNINFSQYVKQIWGRNI